MKVIRHPDDMRAWSYERRAEGKSVGLVPTMGAFHGGHTSLMEASAKREDVSIVSIFVNPAQFAPHEDFDTYPRLFESDCATSEELGMDVVYAPLASALYPDNYATYVEVERLQDGLCGKTRPHFFRGVATVVVKLFNAVVPHRAYFGDKDAQQAAIIRRMTRDLDFGIEILTLPTVREADGMAESSRNAYLDVGGRERGLALSRALFHARDMLEQGERDARRVVTAVEENLSEVDIDYVALVDAEEITPLDRVEGNVLLAAAVTIGETRLIDNIQYKVPESC